MSIVLDTMFLLEYVSARVSSFVQYHVSDEMFLLSCCHIFVTGHIIFVNCSSI